MLNVSNKESAKEKKNKFMMVTFSVSASYCDIYFKILKSDFGIT